MDFFGTIADAWDNITSFATETKDSGLSVLGQLTANSTHFNPYLKRIGGKMINLNIDSKNKQITFDLELKGEKEPINITVNKYEIVEKEDGTFLKIKEVTTSREWINEVIKNLLIPRIFPKKTVEIPPGWSWLLRILV